MFKLQCQKRKKKERERKRSKMPSPEPGKEDRGGKLGSLVVGRIHR